MAEIGQEDIIIIIIIIPALHCHTFSPNEKRVQEDSLTRPKQATEVSGRWRKKPADDPGIVEQDCFLQRRHYCPVT